MLAMEGHFVIFARLSLLPGKRDAFLALLDGVLRGVESEPRCKTITVHEDEHDPDVIILYEIWQGTRAAFERHEMTKPYCQEYRRKRPDLLRAPVEVEWWRPLSEWCSALTLPCAGQALAGGRS